MIWDSPNLNSPLLSTSSAIFSGNSEYSITFGWPFILQNTPTLSCGFALTTDFEAIWTFLSIAIPSNVTSAIFKRALSTPPINTHLTPRSFISESIPVFLSEENTPPFPSEASLTFISFPISIFPFVSTNGNSPCSNNITLFLSYPK